MKVENQNSGSIMQKTIRRTIPYVGIGLHSGKKVSMVVKPADENTGINFIRKDAAPGQGFIPARWYNVVATDLSTMLANEHGVSVSTVEHLMAALRGCGVDNAIIEIDGPEVPIMDGSAEPFVKMIERVGTTVQTAKRHAIWMIRTIEVRDGDKFAILMPSTAPRITVSIDFPESAIGSQTMSVELVDEAFRNDVSRARTFGFADQLEYLRNKGLAQGGSLRNAILVYGDRVVNEEGLRYNDEFVRHKVLDCYGDLSLVGVPIIGHFYGYKPGHQLNNAIVRKLFAERESWSYIPLDEYEALTGNNTMGSSKMKRTESQSQQVSLG